MDSLVPRSIPFIDFLISSALVSISRFSLRAYHHTYLSRAYRRNASRQEARQALIIGAGQTGLQVFDVLTQAASPVIPVGYLDDDPAKLGTVVHGLKVLGKISDLDGVVRDYHISLVIIAMPSAPGKVIREIALTCQHIGVEHQIVPGVYELVTGKVSVNTLRPVSIDDLLRREPIDLDMADIQGLLRGRCVLVTGAGGSIGSELSRQIARCQPARLLLLGHGENSLFSIENRIKAEFPGLSYQTLLVDVQDMKGLRAVFERWQPEVVFHAAAHKHVPMLESNVTAAIENNVRGTCNLVELCNRYSAERMILISTDKAVRPTSIMGMSKRVAELVMLNAALEHPGRFAAVRFGNVLGSRGSVVPIFQEQIAAGG